MVLKLYTLLGILVGVAQAENRQLINARRRLQYLSYPGVPLAEVRARDKPRSNCLHFYPREKLGLLSI